MSELSAEMAQVGLPDARVLERSDQQESLPRALLVMNLPKAMAAPLRLVVGWERSDSAMMGSRSDAYELVETSK